MSIVSHTFETEQAKSPAFTQQDEVYAYSASYLVKDSINLMRSLRRQDHPSPAKVKMYIYDPLISYINWVSQSKQPFINIDVQFPHQYSYDTDSGVLFLHDIDPVLMPVNLDSFDPVQRQKSLAQEFENFLPY
jgi:hypothetical protein